MNRPIPTLASNSKLRLCNGLQMPEEASESATGCRCQRRQVKVPVKSLYRNTAQPLARQYSQSLAMTGFAAQSGVSDTPKAA